MRVGDFIADDSAQNKIGIERFSLRQCYFLDYFKIFTYVWMVPNPTNVLFRYDLGMSGRLRMNVEKGHKFLIFIYDVRRDFTSDYLAENTIRHVYEV